MRLGLISLMFVGLIVTAGCAASQQEAVDPTSDPSWIPPGQGDLTVGADPEVKERPKPRARSLQKPNHRDLDARPLHAMSGQP
jgi:hypothetical protein